MIKWESRDNINEAKRLTPMTTMSSKETSMEETPRPEVNPDEEECERIRTILPPEEVHYLITHDGCPDGITTATLMSMYNPRCLILFWTPGTQLDAVTTSILTGLNVLMVDIAPASLTEYHKFMDITAKFAVLDHHTGNNSKFDAFLNYGACTTLSGATAFQTYAPIKLLDCGEQALQYIQEYDTFTWDDASKLASQKWSYVYWNAINTYDDTTMAMKLCHAVLTDQKAFDELADDKDGLFAALQLAKAQLYNLMVPCTLTTTGQTLMGIDMEEHMHLAHAQNYFGMEEGIEHGHPILFTKYKHGEFSGISLRGPGSPEVATECGGSGHAMAAGINNVSKDYSAVLLDGIFVKPCKEHLVMVNNITETDGMLHGRCHHCYRDVIQHLLDLNKDVPGVDVYDDDMQGSHNGALELCM